MKVKSIAAIIDKVLSEETHVDVDGRLEAVTLEEAIIRAAARRALDPKNRLGMEATRYLTEYQYGKPVQPMAVATGRFGNGYDELSDDDLRELETTILKGAMGGHAELTPRDPGRFIEEGRRGEIIQAVVDTRGEDIFARNKRASAAQGKRREKIEEEDEENPEGTDGLLEFGAERLVSDPWF